MKSRLFVLSAFVVCAMSAFADDEDKVKAKDLEGSITVKGIDSTGAILGDAAANTWSTYDARGKVKVSAKHGEVNKIETYLDWTAPGGVHGHVWEKLWVSADAYTGWSERQISAANAVIFSRATISGDIKQRIQPDGSGVIEWTVGDGATSTSSDSSSGSDNATADATATPKPLPTVDIDEEGTFQGSFFRRIKIKARDNDRASITFTDEGYERMTVAGSDQLLTVQESVTVKGTGKGNLEYNPTPAPTASPSPTVSPSPSASPTASPTVSPTPNDETVF
jgi:hypothetical protein